MKTIIIVLFLLVSLGVSSQESWMHPNEGQWEIPINYKIDLQMGAMFIEDDGFTYFLNNSKSNHSHQHSKEENKHTEEYQAHVIKSKFTNSSWNGVVKEEIKSSFYSNYILGNDSSKWKSKIYSYGKVTYEDFYDGIDLIMDGSMGGFKYSLVVEPNQSISDVEIEYSGQNSLHIDEVGRLIIGNRFGEIIEEAPIAWSIENGRKSKVDIEFLLEGDIVRFHFPNGYNSTKQLVIDPSITFSTFTGSTADNWGMTATPDVSGNLFGGGVIFELGIYPTTTGVFSSTYGGGGVDVGITKFSADGTSLIYSTYIGGDGSETPNSIICSPTGELFIFGITSSTNFPMAGASFNATNNGGPNVATSGNGLGFSEGNDLYVARLSADGTTMLASTYVGGANNDGLNTSNLGYNYGDQFRGEIDLDANGDVYIASMTSSSDFPTTGGSALSGTQDAVVFKMPPGLNAMIWSRFIGGSDIETGNSVHVSSTGDVYVAGGTTSSNMPFSIGYDLLFNGGLSDGYLVRLNGANGNVLSGTYMGNSEYDQTYFVEVDLDDNIYVLGQSESDLGITSGLYGTANSGQFINKYSTDLSTQEWKTMIGAGSGHVEISPTAFLISDCQDIYVSGWGGTTNQNGGQASFSTVTGFEVTADAYQPTTDGSNFYVAVLAEDASYLKYGTFMGGFSNSADHVDGGTSRFDKSGRIYHAVCASCGETNGFTVTPGAWAGTNLSLSSAGTTRCNMAAFKFELNTIEALVSDPNPVVCLPDPVIFTNNSANGNEFLWDFGDNSSTSSEVNPTHLYPGPGNYEVTLVVTDSNECFSADTVFFDVFIGDFVGFVTDPSGEICPNEPYQLEASGGVTYTWSPAEFLDDPTSQMPIAIINETTTFTVIVADTCGADTLTVTVPVVVPSYTISDDVQICYGESTTLIATGGINYNWTPNTYLSDATIPTPICTPEETTLYIVDIISIEGCELIDSVLVELFFEGPIPVMPDSLELCQGTSLSINVSGGETYFWSPNIAISNINTPNVVVNPTSDILYYCDFSNSCSTVRDSVYISVVTPTIEAGNDTIICPGESALMWATGAVSYLWSPTQGLNSTVASLVSATPNTPTVYNVVGIDEFGCAAYDSIFIDLFPHPIIYTNPDVYAFVGDLIQLSATSTTTGTFVWDPSEFLDCIVCVSPFANPDQEYTYTVSYTDKNNCSDSDEVNIFYDPTIYVPNTFTPDGSELNSIFFAKGGNIATFNMQIFNRWGELIFESNEISVGWDGTYDGIACQDGTYVWKINVMGLKGQKRNFVGHVNLIR
mgnify:CR=1 FL=1